MSVGYTSRHQGSWWSGLAAAGEKDFGRGDSRVGWFSEQRLRHPGPAALGTLQEIQINTIVDSFASDRM